MAAQKPLHMSSKIWASQGTVEVPEDAKINSGWTLEVPKFQIENWVQNRSDQFSAHINERGIAEWDATTEYIAGKSYVQGSNGKIYVAKVNSGPASSVQNPVTDYMSLVWDEAFASKASLEGIPARVSALEQFDTDLEDQTEPTKGANLVGYKGRSLSTRNEEMPNIRDMYMPGDGNDWLPAFNRAIATGRKRWYFPGGSAYGLSGTVFWPIGFEIYCEPRRTFFRPLVGAVLTDGFLMMWNTSDGINWDSNYPGQVSGGIYNAIFDNFLQVPNPRGIRTFGPIRIEEIRFIGYRKAVHRPSGFYIDSTSIKNLLWLNPQSAEEYAIDLEGVGDGLIIEDVHFPYDRDTDVIPRGLRIRSCNGGVISGVIGGDHLFEQCRGLLNIGMHNEQGQLVFRNSCGTVQDFVVYPTDRPAFILRNDISGINSEIYKITLRDGYQVYQETATNPVLGNKIMQYDGPIANVSGCMVVVDNVFRAWGADGDLSRNQLTGITFSDGAGAPILDWNNYSYILSRKGTLNASGGGRVSLDSSVYAGDSSFTGISAASQSGFVDINGKSTQWNSSTGTYYYKASIIYDTGRLIGKQQTASEWAVSVNSTSGMVRLYTGFVAIPRTAILRIYRGTASGAYNKVVDIPVVSGDYLYDTGNQVCGHTWKDRPAGPVQTVNEIDARNIQFIGANVRVAAGFMPFTGEWSRGDYVDRINTLPSSGSILIGHKRITSGSGHLAGTDWATLSVSVT